jgi:hypothetical protein
MSPDNEKLAQSISQLAYLMSGVCDDLRREMRDGFAGVIERLDRINTKLDRQNALMQTTLRSLRKF